MTSALRWVKSRALLVAILPIYLYAFPYFATLRNANELPRVLTTIQLAEHHTFRLDDRMRDLGSTADLSTTPSGHVYQNKAPGLVLLALPIYYPVSVVSRAVLGRPPSIAFTTWLLRVLVVTLPCAAFLAVFREVARRFADSAIAQRGAWVAFALGSMAFPYALLFMSHALAAALVGTAFALALRLTRGTAKSPDRFAIAIGATLGLSMLVEYQAVFAALIIAGYVVSRSPRPMRVATLVALTVAPFIGILAAYHAALYGSPFRTGYAYSVDPGNRVGFMGLVGPSRAGIAQMLVRPDNGLIVLAPWVLLALVGAIAVFASREKRERIGAETLVATLVVGVYFAFVASLEPRFGRAGWSVGPRYLAVAVPFLAWLAAAGMDVAFRTPATVVPALALVLVGVEVHVIAATTYPHWPTKLANPLFENSIRLLRSGYASPSLGTLFGLHGIASIAPLYVGIAIVVASLLAPRRRVRTNVALAAVVSLFALSRYELLATSPQPVQDHVWRFVEATVTSRPPSRQ